MVALSAWRGLWGSSTISASAPSPVAAPPTEVAMRWPRAVVCTLCFSFWSAARRTPGKRRLYQGLVSTRRKSRAWRTLSPRL